MKGKVNGDGNLIQKRNSDLEKLMDNWHIERRFFEYSYKYYGVAIQIPLTIIEQIFSYQLDVSIIYFIRHMYTFILFFISLIFFYFLLKKYIVKDKKYALLGVVFLILSPRIYGDNFYNIKDAVFMSLCIINVYFCLNYLNDNSKKSLILICISSAIAINCRVVGGIILFLALIFKLMNSKVNRKSVISMILIILLTYFCYILVTPASWNNPIFFPFEVIHFFFNYSDPVNYTVQKCLYFGEIIDSTKLPWHYLPVWIVITTPILYILLSIIGIFKNISINIKEKFNNINKNYLFCNTILILMLLFVMIFRPVLYGGWRHMYFLYPLIIINAVVGFKYLMNYSKKIKITIVIAVILNCIYLTGWMIKYHPYQYEYFGFVFRNYSIKNFDFNYWTVSNNDAFDYIATTVDKKVKVYPYNEINTFWLSKEKRKKITLVKTKTEADYIIDNSKYGNKKLKEKYIEITYKEVNGYRLYTIYKK